MKFQVTDKKLILIDRSMKLVGDNEYEFEFEFDEEWEGKIKTARFLLGDNRQDVILVDDKCVINKGFFKGGRLTVGVYASNLATEPIKLRVLASILDGDAGDPVVPEEVWTQLIGLIETDVNYVRTSVSNAEDFAQAAKQSKEETEKIAGKFNANASGKLSEYNTNAEEKTTAYNNNHSEKIDAFNANASGKLSEYNTNAKEKIAEYNSNAAELIGSVGELKSDLDDLMFDIDVNRNADYFISVDGTMNVSSASSIKFLTLNKDEVVTVKGAGTKVGVICSVNADYSNMSNDDVYNISPTLTPLLVTPSERDLTKSYSYTATKEVEFIAVCYLVEFGEVKTFQKFKKDYNSELENRIISKIGDEIDISSTVEVIVGKNINSHNGREYDSFFNSTDFFSVEGYSKIEYSQITTSDETAPYGIAFYTDVSIYSYISGVPSIANTTPGYVNNIIDIPNDAKFARVTIRPNETYGKFSIKLYKDGVLSKDIEYLETEIERIADRVNILGYEIYGHESVITSYFDTANDLYLAYDAFLANRNVTKNIIGYGSDTDGNEDTTLPIYEYVIANPITGQVSEAPTILLTSGIHSDEKTAIMALYNFIASLFDTSNDIGVKIRNAVTIKVVPLINPWGYNNTTTQNEGRHNARGVNLNRNFAFNWDIKTDADKGYAMYSETESRALRDWATNNKNAIFHYDFHNHGYAFDYAVFYTASENDFLKRIFCSTIRKTAKMFSEKFNVSLTDSRHFVERNTIPGISSEFNEIVGVKSSIIEMPYGNGTVISSGLITPEVQLIGNIIYDTLCNLKY